MRSRRQSDAWRHELEAATTAPAAQGEARGRIQGRGWPKYLRHTTWSQGIASMPDHTCWICTGSLCMAQPGDRLVVREAVKSPILGRLRDEHIEGELIRVLTSRSIALRTRFDQHYAQRAGRQRHDEKLDEAKNSDCGRLYARWPGGKLLMSGKPATKLSMPPLGQLWTLLILIQGVNRPTTSLVLVSVRKKGTVSTGERSYPFFALAEHATTALVQHPINFGV